MNELVRTCEKEEAVVCLHQLQNSSGPHNSPVCVYLDEPMSHGRTLLKAPKNIAPEKLNWILFLSSLACMILGHVKMLLVSAEA
jgi:hypothetical protein